MKCIMFLLIIPIISVSLCAQAPQIPEFSLPSMPQTSIADTGSSDIYMKAELSASEIKAGRGVQAYFELRNSQGYALRNVRLEVYDHSCFPDGVFTKNDCGSKKDGTIRPNESCAWSWRWTSDETKIDRTCTMRFKVYYEATNSIYQDIAVLSETEYRQKELSGKLGEVPVRSSSAKGPLDIYLTFSEPQPLMADQEGYTMYINYLNKGNGFFGDFAGNIALTPTDNIRMACKDYGSDFVLDKELKFIKGKSLPSECTFDTLPTPSMDIKTMKVDIDYSYTIYSSLSISVKGSA